MKYGRILYSRLQRLLQDSLGVCFLLDPVKETGKRYPRQRIRRKIAVSLPEDLLSFCRITGLFIKTPGKKTNLKISRFQAQGFLYLHPGILLLTLQE